jgi:hypothetical protein
MVTPGDTPVLGARELGAWLERDVGPALREETEAVAHGGTALTMLRLKASTKDVDFGFRAGEDFERFVAALKATGYRVTRDFRPNPRETYLRLERRGAPLVSAVDLRFPTWNNWRLTELVLRRARVIPYGQVRVVVPDRDAVFLFKTYPLRETDVDDLRTIVERSPPDEARVLALFEEQDGLHRAEIFAETVHEPLLNNLELRVRFAASMRLLGPSYQRKIPRIARHARIRFEELRLRPRLTDLIQRIRAKEVMTWGDIIDESGSRLRERLTNGKTRRRAGPAKTSRRTKRRPSPPP